MHITRLYPDDAAAYQQLMLQAYAQSPEAFTSSYAQRAALPLAWWAARLTDTPNNMDVVMGCWTRPHAQAPKLVGVAGITFNTGDKTLHKAHVFGMYVHPEHRQHGIAHQLLRTVIHHALLSPHITILQLTVTQGNQAALNLYQRHGFIAYGLEPMAVIQGAGYLDKVHMFCDIRTLREAG